MVAQDRPLSRRGLLDFVIQRLSAYVLGVYVFVVTGFFVFYEVDYGTLTGFFLSTWMQVFSSLALLATLGHAWVGMWTIGTDYIQRSHLEFIPGLANFSTSIRLFYQGACLLVMFIYLVWAIKLIWHF